MPEANKYAENDSLDLFISARESATGDRLVLDVSGERPDFLCRRPAGTVVGVELTRVGYDYDSLIWSITTGDGNWIDNSDLFACVYAAVENKSAKLREPDWTNADDTILVLDLIAATRQFDWPDRDEYPDSFADMGFSEIWLSDHSTVEAFSAVTLFGIYPDSIWGRNGQEYLDGKPFG